MALDLVTIGDSLTQGFQSGCISRTDISYPALIAHAMKWNFTYPKFPNEEALPLNLGSSRAQFGEPIQTVGDMGFRGYRISA